MATLWNSKTFWINVVAAIALFLSAQFGVQLSAEMTGMILAGINVFLRTVTKEPIEW
ncbi:MAG TPA: hypothetical protein PLD96_03145 [Methanothrix sp.]|nr:hypothetical protein [Methanothrix sp.]